MIPQLEGAQQDALVTRGREYLAAKESARTAAAEREKLEVEERLRLEAEVFYQRMR